MRDFNKTFREYILNIDSDRTVIDLLTFYTPNLTDRASDIIHARMCSGDKIILFLGNQHLPTEMKLKFPSATTGPGGSAGSVALQNVTRDQVEWSRRAGNAPAIDLNIGILNAAGTAIEGGAGSLIPTMTFKMGVIGYRNNTLTIPLIADEIFKKALQTVQFDPSRTPALYA